METYGDLEKIIEKIKEKASNEVEKIRKKAEEEVNRILEEGKREIEEMQRKERERTEEIARREFNRIVEERVNYWRVEVLKEKQKILEELKRELASKLQEMGEEEKEEYIKGIVSKLGEEEGEIIPSVGWEKAAKRACKGFKVRKPEELGGGIIILLKGGGERIDATIPTMVETFWREKYTEIASKVFEGEEG